MIDPRSGDEGRRVVYEPAGVAENQLREPEVGVVSSWNDQYVFVRYGADVGSRATRREDLAWESGT